MALWDLLLDVIGKFLVGIGIGVLLAEMLLPFAWSFILVGALLSFLVKRKYWKRFWA